jgi:hypothetical protein
MLLFSAHTEGIKEAVLRLASEVEALTDAP